MKQLGEVWRSCTRDNVEAGESYFVLNPAADWQPVEIKESNRMEIILVSILKRTYLLAQQDQVNFVFICNLGQYLGHVERLHCFVSFGIHLNVNGFVSTHGHSCTQCFLQTQLVVVYIHMNNQNFQSKEPTGS